MNVTTSPAPKSSVVLEVELPPERLDRAVVDAVRRLSNRTRVAGFRPGKAPRAVLERVLGPEAIMDEAIEHLVSDSYRSAVLEKDIVPLTDPNVEVVQAEAGKPVIYKATVQVRPEVTLGDYRNFNFRPEIETIDDSKVDKVIDELRDQNAALTPATRPAQKGDYAIIAYRGTHNGQPFDGGSTERMPLIIGDERLIPGFEEHLVGVKPGESTGFDITFPDDYAEATLAGQKAHFEVDLKDLRAKILPDADDEFAASMGDYESLDALREEVRHRLGRNALDKARHEFSDKIIDYAVANATLELPDILVDQEVEVMHDEFRGSLARQGIAESAYLQVVKQTDADLHAEFRPRAEGRVKTLLVLSKIAETEGVVVPDADLEAEYARARERYRSDAKLLAYFESERGRNFVRSTLRRSRTVENLVDEWLAAHPDHPAIPHAEAEEPRAVEAATAEATAAIGATDPDAVPGSAGDHAGHDHAGHHDHHQHDHDHSP
ncbi:MAG TPA: trigger factor, partial [Candidatus Acidoferrum sp.]|nr:trigger factor [Candidatus Acidoferrum sp.]